MSMNPSCQVCGMEDAEVVHCTNCECALVATLRARIAELEEGNVRRQVALEARIAELEREREHLSGRLTEVVTAWHASMASGARLREALEKYGEHTSLCDADLDATPCPPCSCGFHEVITEMDGLRGRAALASAWNHGFTKGREYEALDTLEAMQRVGEFTLGEGIDLAAVVAKAVKS